MLLTNKAIERLIAVKHHILGEPRRFNMEYILNPISEAPCGTTCCIAGWLIKLEYPDRQPCKEPDLYMFWEPIEGGKGDITEASNLIDCDWSPLFNHRNWPEAIKENYSRATSAKEQAQAGADAIDSYIVANGNWVDYGN